MPHSRRERWEFLHRLCQPHRHKARLGQPRPDTDGSHAGERSMHVDGKPGYGDAAPEHRAPLLGSPCSAASPGAAIFSYLQRYPNQEVPASTPAQVGEVTIGFAALPERSAQGTPVVFTQTVRLASVLADPSRRSRARHDQTLDRHQRAEEPAGYKQNGEQGIALFMTILIITIMGS